MEISLCDPVQENLLQVDGLLRSSLEGGHNGLEAALAGLITAGGKRIRPRLALLTGNLLAADEGRLLPLAAAIELLHTATLIHDDLVDGASLRRGRPTLNARYPAGVTVLAGDFAFAHAARLAAEAGSLAVMRLFAETLTIMAGGELAQASTRGSLTSREAYYRWIHAKTASLFELASGAAALLSPVGEETAAAARRFGRLIGMAFQIADDVLDFTGDPARVGKPVGSDLRQGVITLPALCFFEAHPDLRPAAGRVEGPQLERLVAAIRANGAISQALREAEGFVQQALQALADLPAAPAREALVELARSIVHRGW